MRATTRQREGMCPRTGERPRLRRRPRLGANAAPLARSRRPNRSRVGRCPRGRGELGLPDLQPAGWWNGRDHLDRRYQAIRLCACPLLPAPPLPPRPHLVSADRLALPAAFQGSMPPRRSTSSSLASRVSSRCWQTTSFTASADLHPVLYGRTAAPVCRQPGPLTVHRPCPPTGPGRLPADLRTCRGHDR